MLVARCVHGLEWVCADEIAARGGTGVVLARREVRFDGPVRDLRTADDLLLAVGAGTGRSPDEVAAALRALPWEDRVTEVRARRPVAPVLDVVADVAGHRFSRFAVEHAVGPLLAARLGGRYLRRTAAGREPGEPDLTVRVSVADGAVTAALRLAARPLHRRDWKRDTGPATLHPPVAAALARLADPAPVATVLDPFCGDGTIAVETAAAYPAARVTGHDLDPARLANAARNAGRAGVAVTWARADAGRLDARADVVLTNPPWSLAVDAAGALRGGLDRFWRRLPSVLAAGGRFVAVADAALAAPDALRGNGIDVGLAVRVRLAGRVSDVVLAGGEPPAALARWHARAVAAGVHLAPPHPT